MTSNHVMVHDDMILRVCVHKDRDCISIVNLDTNALDTQDEGLYINIEGVPDWIQRNIWSQYNHPRSRRGGKASTERRC